MAEVAPLKDAKKRASKPKTALKKKRSSGPSVSSLILEAVAASKERRGLSLSALKKELAAKGYDVVRNKSRVNAAVRRLVENGKLLRTKGTGAAGTFKLNKSTEAKAKKPAVKKSPAKNAATKVKKPAAAKKPKAAAKKTSVKKAKKPAAAAKKAAAKSPKKSPKKAAKKPAAKTAPAARKAPAKRVAKPKAKKTAAKKK